ncbi:hypothetical protein GSI_03690 [Ganoderma sinense ZZ0214-1]|uniref:AB hydrolase-1 domain-containing protein n=1 Tax=Ganoderma sinense ZZ0214-1 TaxID=1077348 RepID=A0A2G8SJN2_9APHY|nr:hypothetical protein GSI_03690 [Ganoderma sinense ZZ0214-1]
MLSSTGLHILQDSGVPPRVDYTTLVFVHGFGCHSGIFARMIPYARKLGARLILVNRRDYPGATPYSEDARSLLSPGTVDPDTVRSSVSYFMKDRALEFSEFLAELVQEEGIPPAQPRTGAGGIMLVGWSIGGLWMTAFLAHVASSPHSQTLRQYVRRVIIYDSPSSTFGYPRPENILDPFMLGMQGDKRFATPEWFSGYFAHGRTVDTPAERAYVTARAPIAKGGSDQLLVFHGYHCGLFREIWERVLYLEPHPPSPAAGEADVGRARDLEPERADDSESDSDRGAWDDVEVRHIWCDMAFWEGPHAALMVQAELADARAHGRRVRDVGSVRLRGMNHFAHWTHPERTLRAFLSDENCPIEVEEPSVRARL